MNLSPAIYPQHENNRKYDRYSRMTERSPVREEGVKGMFRELMEEMRGMRKEMKE